MAEASGDRAGNRLIRRNAMRRKDKENPTSTRFSKGDNNVPGTSGADSEIDNGSCTCDHFNAAYKAICPFSGRERPDSGLSILSSSGISGFVRVSKGTFMADSENESPNSSLSSSSSSSSPSSFRTVTGISDRIGSSASAESTMISSNNSIERKILLARKWCDDHPLNGDGIPSDAIFTCTKCGHVNRIVMPSIPKRPKSFPCGLNDHLLPRPSVTDSESVGLRLNLFDADGVPNQTKVKVADKNGDQCLYELKTHPIDLRHIGEDSTQPKELFSDITGSVKCEYDNTESLLGVLAHDESYGDDSKPDVLLNDFSKKTSDSATETHVQAEIKRRKMYSMYDNVQRCWYCSKYNANSSNANSSSSSGGGVDYFCRVSNRYFCSTCEQEHKKQIPDCVIIVRVK
ncbi:uncharacterized protein LOC127838682 [Dreissena polymorpha]|uniref:Uncharacterized protein n=1 Tax=Dreissena polymorpha TaxID=45954 RepID=A0A9D4FIB4_DREPO|nr:uncharacterized protein LOC127838682 [Dreissena polymorpha]XP_052222515.1 uncharacterized protein LOC127838682 [Dreissena polymorpha]XP_052222516.1 uncharacterized protein LOC127838682 [Dreissena polymorpha]KAH3798852.1 hypothetical protein DPMN_152455 [Dreissena polymorpha]